MHEGHEKRPRGANAEEARELEGTEVPREAEGPVAGPGPTKSNKKRVLSPFGPWRNACRAGLCVKGVL